MLPSHWIIVPLGNPGGEYALTRHNLGRLMVQRWMDGNPPAPTVAHRYCHGALYSLAKPFFALVPSTYMNLSGKAVAEAVKGGLQPRRMVVIYDDKDLPLGTGRLSGSGSSGGHNGLQSIMDALGNESVLRLRLGMGPYQRPLKNWVLGEWAPEEWGAIENMDGHFAEFMSGLAVGMEFGALQSRVNNPAFWRE